MAQQAILIYCDGGFGNRLNTLISGLAVARIFKLVAKVYWPRNNWCQAGFSQIFANAQDVSEHSLIDLAGTLSKALPLLHDTLGADALGVSFHSAYDYASLNDFGRDAVSSGRDLFYYPALIPPWLPLEHAVLELQCLTFEKTIRDEVASFVCAIIGKPFHGLHLRRTDLNVGLSDEEVQELVRLHPHETFFVCSDDPIAEAMAAAHPHVHRRVKNDYVGKRNAVGSWNDLTADDDGRMYHSNIDRSSGSVIDGVIDLLILAHSSIVGFTGSTFQNMARLCGDHAPIVHQPKPAVGIQFLALSTARQMLRAGNLPLSECVTLGISLFNQGRKSAAIVLEKDAIEYSRTKGIVDANTFLLHHNAAAHLIQNNHPYEASLYAEKALVMFPDSLEAKNLLAAANLAVTHAH
jgi:hypothetical protein